MRRQKILNQHTALPPDLGEFGTEEGDCQTLEGPNLNGGEQHHYTMSNTAPKLHNAMWPGPVGKGDGDGEGQEPPISLERMLDLSAGANVGGQKFEGIDYESFRPSRRRSKPKPVIFISYSHQDERHLKTLNLHLTVLKNLGLIHKVWHDRRIQPGMDWDRAIQEEITQADVVLFLTSTASLASGYINQDELRPALERHVKGDAVIVPIILEPCDWVDSFANSPPLKKLKERRKRVPQGLPRDNKPINSFTLRSNGWHLVSEGLKELLTEVKAKLK